MGGTSATSSLGRWAVACALCLSVVPLSACREQTSCRGLEYDIASSAVGAPSQQAALDAFLGSGDSRDFPTDGWTGPSPAGVFTSGAAKVTVTKPPGSSYWFVTSARSC